MKAKIFSLICALLMALGLQAQNAEFETATEAVKNMKVGWNLGNTLDAAPTDREGLIYDPSNYVSYESDWGQPVTKPELLKMLRKAGFNAIRVPVTWFPYTDANGNVDSRWMKRVHEVVDYVIDQGMYCLLNVHHDTGGHKAAWIRADESNYQKNHERYENLWRQIANEFKDYDERLLFESYNEMLDIWGSWGRAAWGHDDQMASVYTALNNYAQSFVKTVRSTGGNNKKRNLVINTYATGDDTGKGYPLTELQLPDDETEGHFAIQIHYYPDTNTLTEKKIDESIEKWDKGAKSKGAPLIIGEWGFLLEPVTDESLYKNLLSLSRYFVEKTKSYGMATFSWDFIVSGGVYRNLPAVVNVDFANALVKGYYGDWYEPVLTTIDDYDYQGIKVSYEEPGASIVLFGELNLADYKGIRIELDNPDGLVLKALVNWEGKEQALSLSSTNEALYFDKDVLGDCLMLIILQNMKEEANTTRIRNTYLIKNDGTEELISLNSYWSLGGLQYEVIMPRKQYVHTVAYDGQWSELNLFYDDIPLKLKNYKGIRVELAEKPQEGACHIKVYGDGEQKEDYLPPLTETSTTILFNTDIFSNEINRITLQNAIDGKNEVKVISAWLIRQDGTEEFCDLSPFWGCEITSMTDYVAGISPVIVAPVDNAHHRIYNLNGQRLEKPQKGINIIDGKKVFVK